MGNLMLMSVPFLTSYTPSANKISAVDRISILFDDEGGSFHFKTIFQDRRNGSWRNPVF